MNKKFLVYSLVGLLNSFTVTGLVLTNSKQAQSLPASGNSQQPKSVRVDRHFIEMMIPHHQMAVKMAQMASKRAAHPDLRNLARSIIKSQNAEISKMQGWQQAWK